MLKEFLKNYGAVVGPFLGFVFGALALYVKYWFDERTNHRNTERKLHRLFELIKKNKPPTLDIPKDSSINIFREYEEFQDKVDLMQIFIKKVEDDVLKHCNIHAIENFFFITIAIDIMKKEMETAPREELQSLVNYPHSYLSDHLRELIGMLHVRYKYVTDAIDNKLKKVI